MLRQRWHAHGAAGLRRLYRRAQYPRPRLRNAVRHARLHRAYARRRRGSTRSMPRAACRIDQSRRNTTEANQPVGERHQVDGETVENAVVARGAGDELLDPDLDHFQRRARSARDWCRRRTASRRLRSSRPALPPAGGCVARNRLGVRKVTAVRVLEIEPALLAQPDQGVAEFAIRRLSARFVGARNHAPSRLPAAALIGRARSASSGLLLSTAR